LASSYNQQAAYQSSIGDAAPPYAPFAQEMPTSVHFTRLVGHSDNSHGQGIATSQNEIPLFMQAMLLSNSMDEDLPIMATAEPQWDDMTEYANPAGQAHTPIIFTGLDPTTLVHSVAPLNENPIPVVREPTPRRRSPEQEQIASSPATQDFTAQRHELDGTTKRAWMAEADTAIRRKPLILPQDHVSQDRPVTANAFADEANSAPRKPSALLPSPATSSSTHSPVSAKTLGSSPTDDQDYRCPYPGCDFVPSGKANLRKVYLKKHLTKHGPERFVCPGCDREFTRKDNLVVHMKESCPRGGIGADGRSPIVKRKYEVYMDGEDSEHFGFPAPKRI
jgi:hypothetical protein